MANIIDLITGQLGPALASQAAQKYGESDSAISKVLSALVPVVLGGFANHADNPTLLDAITGANAHGFLSNPLTSTQGNSVVGTIKNLIFGNRSGEMESQVASYAGVSPTTVNGLTDAVTGATLGSVNKYATENNLDRNGLAEFLRSQKSSISSMLPAGLATLGAFGLGNSVADGAEKVQVKTETVTPKTTVTEPKPAATNTYVNVDEGRKDSGSIWKWLIPLLIILGLLYWLFNHFNKDKKVEQTTTTTTTTTDTLNNNTNSTDTLNATVKPQDAHRSAPINVDLNGTTLKGYANGLEDSMVRFLKSGGYDKAANDDAFKTTWYDFDNVRFVFGKNNQLETGKDQLDNLAKILEAYPAAKIKIGGYTDKKGDEAVNKKLSQERADFIKSELVKRNVGDRVVSAEGYGSQFATQPESATDEQRSVDRKMAVRFTK